jgi:hypothetical protein
LPASIRETHTDVVANPAHRVRDYLREINVELVTVRQGVDGIFKDLPAIRDTAGKATMILDELSVTSAKISTLYDELPMMSGKITTIHDGVFASKSDIPLLLNAETALNAPTQKGFKPFDLVVSGRLTVIHAPQAIAPSSCQRTK